MASEQSVIAVSNVIITVLPSVVSLIKSLLKKSNPELPPPTSEEILLSLSAACASSIAKDDEWLAAHPV